MSLLLRNIFADLHTFLSRFISILFMLFREVSGVPTIFKIAYENIEDLASGTFIWTVDFYTF